MSFSNQDNVIFCENKWNDIVKKYKLNHKLDVIIHQDDREDNKTSSTAHTWILRTFLITSIFTLVGNIPVRSQAKSIEASNFLVQSNESIIEKTIDPTLKPTLTIAPIITVAKSINKVVEIKPTDTSEIRQSYTLTTVEPQELMLPKHALETYIGQSLNDTNVKWQTYHVKSYDNLTNIFYKIGQSPTLKTLKSDTTIYNELKKLKKGSIVRSSTNNGKLLELVISHNNIDSFIIKPTNIKTGSILYTANWKQGIFEVRQSRSSLVIRNGLFYDGRKAGISNNIIKQIVKVFDWDIDFSHDIRVGDKVTAVYEEVFHDGEKVGDQNLLAAEFINKGRELRTIRYTNFDGKPDYFTPEGREMKRAFIRTPIAHARVSSHFNPGRFHPVLHKIKKHEGTDFAARTGTPIMASGNGKIIFLGRKGGYGRTIIIRHREGYTTKYAHMSRFKKGLRVGKKVYQSDIIGYVGSSGRATGPHLHYEFRKNGIALNPMKARLPNSMSLSRRELQDFRNTAINLVLQLNVLHRFVKAKIEINSAIGG